MFYRKSSVTALAAGCAFLLAGQLVLSTLAVFGVTGVAYASTYHAPKQHRVHVAVHAKKHPATRKHRVHTANGQNCNGESQ